MGKLTTINISLPEKMYKDVRSLAKNQSYSSVSEVVRDALRKLMNTSYSIDSTPQYLVDAAIAAEKEPVQDDVMLESEEDIDSYFLNHKK